MNAFAERTLPALREVAPSGVGARMSRRILFADRPAYS